jgi:cell division protein FtsZ
VVFYLSISLYNSVLIIEVEMDSIISDAVSNEREEQEQRQQAMKELEDIEDPQIVIVGVGGGGNNTIRRLDHMGVDGAETIAVNTDKQDLQLTNADQKILIGRDLTGGRGAGGDPKKGKRAAESAREELTGILENADLVFISAGMGGGTGTGAAPVIAEIAAENGAIVVGMVTLPFELEGGRHEKAKRGLDNLRRSADSVIALDNQRLLEYVPDLPMEKCFTVLDQLIAETVKGISETITQHSLINLDFADIRTIMSKGGIAVMLVGETSSENPEKTVVDDALNHPLLDVDYEGATGALVHVTGGPNLTLSNAESIASGLTKRIDSEGDVMWGARISDDSKGSVKVLAVMTGIDEANVFSDVTATSSTREEDQSASADAEKLAQETSSTIDQL